MANVYLEGTYSEIYPRGLADEAGLRRLFRQFSTPGGIPSHVSVPTPGSIHEGGELGYALVHAFGAAFDNPDLLVACVVGDGEAETGPLEGSWKGVGFLNPARDGAVLPILHLNGYKISGPTVLGRASDEEIAALLAGHGYEAHVRRGRRSAAVHRSSPRRSTIASRAIDAIQATARGKRRGPRARAGRRSSCARRRAGPGRRWSTACRSRAPSAPTRCRSPACARTPSTWRCSRSGCAATGPRSSSTTRRASRPRAGGAGAGRRQADGREPPRQRRPAAPAARAARTSATTPWRSSDPVASAPETTRPLGELLRDVYRHERESADFRLFCPDETNSNRLGAVFEVEDRCLMDARPDRRSRQPRRPGDGGAVRAPLRGLAGGLPADRPSRPVRHLRGVRDGGGVDDRSSTRSGWRRPPTLPWREPVAVAEHPADLDLLAQRPQRLQPPGAGADRHDDLACSGERGRASTCRPTPTACSRLPTTACSSRNYVNLIVVDKQPHLQYLDIEAAREHAAARRVGLGLGIERRAAATPDVVLALRRRRADAGDARRGVDLRSLARPSLRVRVVNVVDLMRLFPPDPSSARPRRRPSSTSCSAPTTQVVFAFHGYARALHQLLHGRVRPERFHVRGFTEQGTTTTPFDMVVLNQMSRYHLVLQALRRARRPGRRGRARAAL